MTNSLKLIKPAIKDIGDFEVRRLLPSGVQRSVGPFVFWDHFGPVTLAAGNNMDVRPHPHIGLATLTWLFEGEIMHRDSLGKVQNITPGAVNWMTAGRGIVHSERTPEERRGKENRMHGLQIWMGLPETLEDMEPDFTHYPADTLPRIRLGAVEFDLIAGEALGQRSPVRTYSPLCYLAARLQPGERFSWPRQYSEQAVYLVQGNLEVDGNSVPIHHMAMLENDETVLTSADGCTIALLAGEPIGPRRLWWNFVASQPEMIREAAENWKQGGFDRVPGDDEFIPIPESLKLPRDN